MTDRPLRWLAAALVWGSLASGVAAAADPGYRVEPKAASARELRTRFAPDELALLEKLNRADASNLHRLEQLVVPSTWDEMAHSPFPHSYPVSADVAKMLVIDQHSQAFAAYERGRLVRWGPVSTGRKAAPTPSGIFQLNWRARSRVSTIDDSWLLEWYFNFHDGEGLALHKYDLPGLPASHGCVRLLERDAIWMYEWGETGTPLWIVGAYQFGAPPPWRSLEFLSLGVTLPEGTPGGTTIAPIP